MQTHRETEVGRGTFRNNPVGFEDPKAWEIHHRQVGVWAAGPSTLRWGCEQPLSSKCSSGGMAWHPPTGRDPWAQAPVAKHRLQGALQDSQEVPRESQGEHLGQAGPSPDLPTPGKGRKPVERRR